MEDLLIETLEAFGYPVMLQGSLPPEQSYPQRFFTYWNTDSDSKFYGNTEQQRIYEYDVNYYTNDFDVFDTLREAVGKLRKQGFIVSGDGHSLGTDDINFTGRGIKVLYLLQL